jgi:hypothetical protein
MSNKIGITPGIGTNRRRVATDVGVQRPEVEVGVLLVHGVGALRSGTPSPRRGRAAGGGKAEEAAAQGGRSHPSHAALGSLGWRPAAAAVQEIGYLPYSTMFFLVNLPFLRWAAGIKKQCINVFSQTHKKTAYQYITYLISS